MIYAISTQHIFVLVLVGCLIVFASFGIQIILKDKEEKKLNEENKKQEEVNTTEAIAKVEESTVTEVSEEPQETVETVEAIDTSSNEVSEAESNKKVSKGKYEVFKEGEFFRYRLKARNGEVLFESDIFPTEVLAIDQVEIVKRNCENGIFSTYEGVNGSYYYKLTSKNHRTLVTSTQFQSKKAAEEALGAFKRNASTDVTVILTEDENESNMEIFEDNTQGNDDKGSYEVLPSGKKFYFVLRTSTDTTLCHSMDYVSKTSCLTALKAFRSIVYEGTFYICQDKNDKYHFKLYNKQNKLVMTGDLQNSKTRVQNYIKLIKRYALLAPIK